MHKQKYSYPERTYRSFNLVPGEAASSGIDVLQPPHESVEVARARLPLRGVLHQPLAERGIEGGAARARATVRACSIRSSSALSRNVFHP